MRWALDQLRRLTVLYKIEIANSPINQFSPYTSFEESWTTIARQNSIMLSTRCVSATVNFQLNGYFFHFWQTIESLNFTYTMQINPRLFWCPLRLAEELPPSLPFFNFPPSLDDESMSCFFCELCKFADHDRSFADCAGNENIPGDGGCFST